MSSNSKDVIHKDNIVQAVVVADTFGDEFLPITNDIPLSLIPLLNKPLLDYTLEFLSLGGVEETFLFCCSHVNLVKEYIKKSVQQSAAWSLNMKVHILVSECCRSFGDCLRDIDAKGLLRGDFILLEPGVISNIKLLPILKKHKDIAKKDKGAAITLVYQEAGIGQLGRCSQDEVVVAIDSKDRVIFHKKIGCSREKKVEFPLELFLENNEVSILNNLKDTHIAVCSSSVLPLFSDNFDFQTRDDFVKGLLMNEEIMGSTMYLHTVKGVQYGGAVTNWQNYQALSWEVKDRWTFPLIPTAKENRILKNNVVVGMNNNIPESANISRCIIGDNVSFGKNVHLQDSFVMSGCKIGNDVTINLSVVGPDCDVRNDSELNETVLGKSVTIDKGSKIVNELIQRNEPDLCEKQDILGKYAYKVTLEEDEDDDDTQKIRRLIHFNDLAHYQEPDDENDGFSDSDDEDLSYTHSPAPDDTKLFFTEVIDSLTRGFEDELQCDNLILEINSSRYAYNISVKEVNFNVIKAILHMYLRQPTGPRFFSQLLSYFFPILKNYIRNENAMVDCLEAIEDVAITNEEVKENWVLFVLEWFYNKDILAEESILKWGKAVDSKTKFSVQIKPFLQWLEEAEEASSDEE